MRPFKSWFRKAFLAGFELAADAAGECCGCNVDTQVDAGASFERWFAGEEAPIGT